MHYVSTIFTTIGYGGVTPVTLGTNHLIFAISILIMVKKSPMLAENNLQLPKL